MIAVIDYDAGNVANVGRALDYIGAASFLTSDPGSLRTASAILLPGVGAFGHAAGSLYKNGFIDAIKDEVKRGKAFLGICLGMQLLFHKSQEAPGAKGLGLIEGDVLKFETGLKVPHVGYNSILDIGKSNLLDGLNDPYFYFVHSYYCRVNDRNAACYKTDYGVAFDSVIEKDNIFAVQFHPEKSGAAGLRLLENFIKIAGNI